MVRRWPGHSGEKAIDVSVADHDIAIHSTDARAAPRLRSLTPADAHVLGRLLWRGFGTQGADGFTSTDAAGVEAHDTHLARALYLRLGFTDEAREHPAQ